MIVKDESEMKQYLCWLGACLLLLAWTLSFGLSPDLLAVRASPPQQQPRNLFTGNAAGLNGEMQISQRHVGHEQGLGSTTILKLGARFEPLAGQLKYTSIGTGWPLASGYIVTSNHVVAESTEVLLISALNQEILAWTVLRDEVNDIALLEVTDVQKLPPALPLATSQSRLGTSVFTIGFPRVNVMGTAPKLSTGVISGMNGLQDDPVSYHTSVPIQPGNSGGPLLNMKGEVVGVVTSMLGIRAGTKGDIQMLQNASCVLKVECLKNLLPLLPKRQPIIDVLPRHTDSLETLAERIQDSVLIVLAR
jgi:S1-C subfamily serine protease